MKKINFSKLNIIFISFFLHQSSVIAGINMSFSDIFAIILAFRIFLIEKYKINMYHIIFLCFILIVYLIDSCFIIPIKMNINIEYIKLLSEIIKIIILFIFFELGIFLKNNRKIEYMLKYYSYSALFITIFSIGITITKINPFYNRLYLVSNRLNGLIIDPNYFSILEISSLPYFLNNKKLNATKKIIYSLIILIGTIMSGSKTGFIILSVYIVYRFLKSILNACKFNEYNKLLYLFIIFIFIILIYNNINDFIYYLNVYFPISNRVTSIFLNFNNSLNSGGSSRLYAWRNGIELIKLFPFTGVGKGNNSIIASILFSNGVIAHNTYIQIFVDWGPIIGILLFTYFIYKYFKVFKNYNTYVIEREILTIYLLGSLGISLDNSRMLWLIIGSILFFNNYMCYTDK